MNDRAGLWMAYSDKKNSLCRKRKSKPTKKFNKFIHFGEKKNF